MSYELTSPRVIQDDLKVNRAGLCLLVEDGKLVAEARSGYTMGLCAGADVACKQDEFSAHFLLVPFDHGRAPLPPAEGQKAWRLLELAERALWAAELNAWDKAGEFVDAGWAEDRADLPANPKLDMAYAAARLAGAYGGRPVAAGFALLAPPDKHEAIRGAVK